MTTTLRRRSKQRLARARERVVAFSGGVDSSLVAALAARALGDRALAVTAVSPALATGELDGARAVAAAIGIAHETITRPSSHREGYRANERDRCYHCKSELYDALDGLAPARGYAAVLSGANADDVGDWRPGLSAAPSTASSTRCSRRGRQGRGARARPRARRPERREAGVPCLASRIPYGTAVDPSRSRRSTAPSWR